MSGIFSNFRNIEYAFIFLIAMKLCFNGAALVKQFRSNGNSLFSLSSTEFAYAQQGVSFPGEQKASPINIDILETIKKRSEDLDAKENSLKQQEEQLNMLKLTLEEKMQKMNEVQKKIEELLAARTDLIERSVKHLVKVYSSMKPNEAARLLEKLDKDISIQILSKMKGKSAAKILEKMDGTMAANISDKIATRK